MGLSRLAISEPKRLIIDKACSLSLLAPDHHRLRRSGCQVIHLVIFFLPDHSQWKWDHAGTHGYGNGHTPSIHVGLLYIRHLLRRVQPFTCEHFTKLYKTKTRPSDYRDPGAPLVKCSSVKTFITAANCPGSRDARGSAKGMPEAPNPSMAQDHLVLET
ncbi:hypothetical protein DFH07DRAFT_855949 [Mycena maculata]|uniref:Uncharacterized protein n=1 Tax=Mycena maculata TaxID=230809 RepID=A0AAD7HLH3_9AGAR|nr:hypothetical protein DFH07DRAFT_855949 [Mycena maculata]